MSVKDRIANADPYAPAKAYNRYIGGNPYVEAGALGTAGALTGYMATDLALRKFSPQTSPERRRMLRNIMAALMATGGATYAMQKHVDPQNPWKSLTDKDYWKDPANRQDLLDRQQEKIDSAEIDLRNVPKFDWGRGAPSMDSGLNIIPYEARRLLPQNIQQRGDISLAKEGSFTSAFEGRTVPVRTTINLLDQDPFLSLADKKIVKGMIVDANDGLDAGKTSGKSLMSTAVKAGVGFGAAYLFGQGVGGLLSLPPEQTKKLSQVGGLAGAIYNSGILT
jgi:hypothetical protein